MKPASLGLPPERLLEQADFVRALARGLLADPAAAEDVTQDALVAGLEHPPTEAGALRGWLVRVVNNLARQRGRGEARRAGREQLVARAERVPSTAEVLEREAARASVVRAVLALDEPYRSAILLRFYESRPPREIARLLEVPVETVHTRTKRALGMLRERLDREFGSRSAWAALILPFTRPPLMPAGEGASSASPKPKGTSMHPALKLAGLGLALAAGTAYWLRSGESERSATASVAAAPVVVLSPASPDRGSSVERAELQRTAIRPSSSPASAPELVAPPPPASNALSTASLHLTVTWSDGTPAADLQARVTDVGRNSYDPLEARTDAAGECTVTGLRAGKVWITLDRKNLWSKAQVAAGEETEVAIQLEPGWNVEGVVVDVNGDAVEGAVVWLGGISKWGSPESAFAVTSSAADGSFTVRSCPDLGSLWARAPGHAPSLVRTIEETRMQPAGTTVNISLALRGAGASVAGQVRDPEGNPVEGALVLVDGQGMLRAYPHTLPGGEQIYLSHSGPTCVRTDASGSFALAGVRPGTVPLGVLVPGYAAWRGSVAAAAGETGVQEIPLTAGFRLVGTVRDAAGNPVGARVNVWAPRLSTQLSPTVMTGPDGAFEIDGISPGEIHVVADAGGEEAWTTLTGQAGDELTWDALLGPEDGSSWMESQPWR